MTQTTSKQISHDRFWWESKAIHHMSSLTNMSTYITLQQFPRSSIRSKQISIHFRPLQTSTLGDHLQRDFVRLQLKSHGLLFRKAELVKRKFYDFTRLVAKSQARQTHEITASTLSFSSRNPCVQMLLGKRDEAFWLRQVKQPSIARPAKSNAFREVMERKD